MRLLVGKFSNIIEISCNDNVALRAQEFANALAQAYIAQSIYKKTREAAKTLSLSMLSSSRSMTISKIQQ